MTKELKQLTIIMINDLKRLTGVDQNISKYNFKDVVGLKMHRKWT